MSDSPNKGPKPSKRLKVWSRRIAAGVALVATTVVVAWLLAPSPTPVDVATVRRGHIRATVDVDGISRVKDRFVIVAPIAGNLARLEIHAGDTVDEGEDIARLIAIAPPLLDPRARAQAEARVGSSAAAIRQAEATVTRLRTALDLARREEARLAQLAERGATSAQSLDVARVSREESEQALTSAEFGLRIARHENLMARAAAGERMDQEDEEQLVVRSPIRGHVLRVLRESEGPVAPGEPVVELGDAGALELVVDALTSDAVQIASCARATVTEWGGARALDAHVRLVEPSARTRISALGVEEQRVNVVLDLDSPAAWFTGLGDGFRVEVSITTAEARNAAIIPELSVFRDGRREAVFVEHGGRVRRRAIDVGLRNGVEVEVRRGLRVGERVVVHPSEHLEDGARVTLR